MVVRAAGQVKWPGRSKLRYGAVGLDLERVRSGLAIANFLDGGGDDGSRVLRVTEFKVHAAANVLQLEHGASPGGAGDGDLNWLGTEFGMAGEQGLATAQKDGGVAVVHGLNL